MSPIHYGYVPTIDTKAGACLTALNWQEVGISAVTCTLQSLLIKPGACVLKQFTGLAQYMGWQGALILDARMSATKTEGLYCFQSPYDGAHLQIKVSELVDLIIHLSPDHVLLPLNIHHSYPDIWQRLPEHITPFIAASDRKSVLTERNYGVYITPDLDDSIAIEQVKRLPFIWIGEANQGLMKQLKLDGALWISTERPLQDAYQSCVYTSEGSIDLNDSAVVDQFEVIDKSCRCPTCEQGLSRSYLAHLYVQTPLLCHRFLIQHNVYLIQQRLMAG